MFKKVLLGSVACTAFVAGALYFGVHSVRADEGPRFVFRYSPGVLVAAVDGGSEGEEPGGEDGGTDSDDDGENGGADPDDGSEEKPGGGDGEPEVPSEPAPVHGIVFTPRLELRDTNSNGYGDAGEQVYLRTTIRNATEQEISGVRIEYRILLGENVVHSAFNSLTLAAGESFEGATFVHLNAEGLADLAAGLQFEGLASLVELGSESWSFETHARVATFTPFGVYEPVQPEEITLSSVSARHLDSDGDGYGDRGELVRVSFTARNTGGLPAQGVSFEISFPEWPSATAYCDRASLPANGSMACTADIEFTRDDLDAFGAPETDVTLNGVISMVSLNTRHYAAGEHATVLTPVSFRVPPVVYAPHLRVVASDGWVFECATPWDAAFVDENRAMFLTRWNTGDRTIGPAGGKTVVGNTFNLQSTWILISAVNTTTGRANAIKNSMRSGDTRPAIPSDMPHPCGTMGQFHITSHGDLTIAYDIIFESVEVVNLPM